jgi:hypothetical protein
LPDAAPLMVVAWTMAWTAVAVVAWTAVAVVAVVVWEC